MPPVRAGRTLLLALALAGLAAAAPTAQAALRHEVVEAPAGSVPPETAVPLRLRFEADCTSLLARLRGPEPGVPMQIALASDPGLELAGPEGARFDATPCIAEAAQQVAIEVDCALVVRRGVPAFAPLGLRVDAALAPLDADEAATRAEATVTAAPLLFIDAGTPQQQFLDDGGPIRPRLELANLGNADVLVTVRPDPGLEGAPAPFRLAAGGRVEVEFLHAAEGPLRQPRTFNVTWEAAVLRDGAPTDEATAGTAAFQVLPGDGEKVAPRTWLGLVAGAGVVLLAALFGLLFLLGRWADRRL